MRRAFSLGLAAVAAFMCCGGLLHAADEAGKPIVARSLEKIKYNSPRKPNLKAKYYMYVQGAGWNETCREVLPRLVKQYGDMKASDMEVVFISHDYDDKTTKKFLARIKAPMAWYRPVERGNVHLPGFTWVGSLPYFTIVTDDGRVLADGYADSTLDRWHEALMRHEEASAAEDKKE